MHLPPDIVAACVGRKARNQLEKGRAEEVFRNMRPGRRYLMMGFHVGQIISLYLEFLPDKRFFFRKLVSQQSVEYDFHIQSHNAEAGIWMMDSATGSGCALISSTTARLKWVVDEVIHTTEYQLLT